jgi:hypothetical protein
MDILLNAKYLVLKKANVKNQFTFGARQVFTEDSASLYEAFFDANKRAHGYLILDFAQDIHDIFRFRNNNFPHEYQPIIYAAVDDKTYDMEFPRVASITNSKT